ncbi:MAG: DUF4476 domain-containing protein [Myxococcaceae bacterium]|nr:DUF4476 domain-containing protein [Myxococcaceae bacterium]MCI0670134.1 DUF4476 domain-containing protein [Myxococcaceae bacterium]
MRALALLSVLLVSTTALADPEALRRPRPNGTPVVVERESLQRRLTKLEETLAEALENGSRSRSRSRQLLRRALEEMEDLQELVEEAPELSRVTQPPPPPRPPQPTVQPLQEDVFNRLSAAMQREAFGEDKMRLLRDAAGRHYFLVTHVERLLKQFSFSRERLEVVRLLWPRVLDRENGVRLYSHLTYRDEKQQLEDILKG